MLIALLGQTPTAPELLTKVAATYHRLTSYQDTVQVVSTYTGGEWRQSFKTSFERPNRWRLDYTEFQPTGPASKCVLWSNGKSIQLWASSDGQKPTHAPEIGIGFGSMAMIAGYFVKIVPSLLAPKDIYSSAIKEWKKPMILSDAKVGSILCSRISGQEGHGSKLTLFIDKKRYLILKIVRDSNSPHHGKGRATATITPTPNPKHPSTTFNFIAPK